MTWNDHERYFAPVDNTQRAFEDYEQFLEKMLSEGPITHSVLFHGETGCGKTSLMNRCASLMKEKSYKYNGKNYKFYIIDTRNLKISIKSADEKIETIIKYIEYVIEQDSNLPGNLNVDFKNKISDGLDLALAFLALQMDKYSIS